MPKKANEVVSERPKFKLSELRENAVRLFGVSSATFDGATHGLDCNKEFTVAEVKNIIANWNKKEAK